MTKFSRQFFSMFAVLLGGLPAAAIAWSPGKSPDIHLHGYFAQAYVVSDSNNVNGPSSQGGGSLDFREAAVNASYRTPYRMLVSAQAAYVRRGQVADEDLLLDYAVIDFAAYQGQSSRLGLRGGKLKQHYGLFNDARDAVFTRPGILMPQGVYLDNDGARAFGYFSLPGLAVYGDLYAGRHMLQLELSSFVKSALDDTAEVTILRRTAPGRFSHRQSHALRIIDDLDGGRYRLALTASTGELDYEVDADTMACLAGSQSRGEPPFCSAGRFQFDQAFASFEFNTERVSLLAEVVRRHIELDNLIPPGIPASSQTEQDSVGYYLHAMWRAVPRIALYARYDARYRELQDRSGHRQAEQSGLPRHYFFARDWTLGSRWMLGRKLDLWAEVHLVDGVGWINPVDNPGFNAGTAKRHWSLLTAMLAYRF